MDNQGRVIVQGNWRNDFTEVCDDQGGFGNIDSVTCLAWFGAAVKAQSSGIKVTVYYPNDGGYTCANMPTYASSLIPGYFMLTQ
jgi:hypothetical protein